MAYAPNVVVPSAATAAVYTITAVTGKIHSVRRVFWSYSAAPTGGKLTIESPSGTILFEQDITAAGPGSLDLGAPIKGVVSQALIVRLASGAGAVVGKLNVPFEALNRR